MATSAYLNRLSFQLYSARNAPSLPELLKRLAELGYARVETWGGQYADLDGLAGGLEAAGLKAASGHIGLAMVRDDPAAAVEVTRRLGMTHLFVPAIPPADRPADAAGWRALGATLEVVGKPVADAGVRFGWHNHAFEFEALADGSYPIEHIFAGGPSLAWEIDLGWLVRAGQDPLVWLEKYADRIVAAHVKDIAEGLPEEEDGWADVGHGTMDWASLGPACIKAGAELLVVEHDKPADYDRFAARSIAAVSAW